MTAVDADIAGRALAFVPGTAIVGQVLGQAVDPADPAGPADQADPADPAGPTVEVLALVGDDPVPPGHDPAMRRRRDRAGTDGPPRRTV